jgi:dihydroorotate dehydrogenase (NAD+) catalytic subunit
LAKSKVSTKVTIGSLQLKNPVMTASGTFGYGIEFEKYLDLNSLGAIIVKGLAIKPVKGNKPQRLIETPAGIINAIGLQNIGVEQFLEDKLPKLEKLRTPVIANIYGTSIEEYTQVAQRLADTSVAGIEINISCPNVKKGGIQFAGDKDTVIGILASIKKIYKKLIIVKLSPNTGNTVEMAKICEDNGADSVSVINTLIGMSVDIQKRRPHISNIYGGLSGPAIKPVALAFVHKVSRAVKIPVIGVGGIMTGTDAVEFLMAGATAVQVGTATFRDPRAAMLITKGVEEFMVKNNVKDVKEITNCLKCD